MVAVGGQRVGGVPVGQAVAEEAVGHFHPCRERARELEDPRGVAGADLRIGIEAHAEVVVAEHPHGAGGTEPVDRLGDVRAVEKQVAQHDHPADPRASEQVEDGVERREVFVDVGDDPDPHANAPQTAP